MTFPLSGIVSETRLDGPHRKDQLVIRIQWFRFTFKQPRNKPPCSVFETLHPTPITNFTTIREFVGPESFLRLADWWHFRPNFPRHCPQEASRKSRKDNSRIVGWLPPLPGLDERSKPSCLRANGESHPPLNWGRFRLRKMCSRSFDLKCSPLSFQFWRAFCGHTAGIYGHVTRGACSQRRTLLVTAKHCKHWT
jgi:hypothetical protein